MYLRLIIEFAFLLCIHDRDCLFALDFTKFYLNIFPSNFLVILMFLKLSVFGAGDLNSIADDVLYLLIDPHSHYTFNDLAWNIIQVISLDMHEHIILWLLLDFLFLFFSLAHLKF